MGEIHDPRLRERLPVIIELPFPDFSLSPNRKNGKHWSSTQKAKVSRKDYAYYVTKQALAFVDYEFKPKRISLDFIAPTRRRFDLDNALSACKADIDGICMALGIDDSAFETVILRRGYSKGNGKTVVYIDPM
jgi:crossover junction endodeoxyribonuclease RusA